MTDFLFHTAGIGGKVIIQIFAYPLHCTESYNDGYTSIVHILIGHYPILVLRRV